MPFIAKAFLAFFLTLLLFAALGMAFGLGVSAGSNLPHACITRTR